MTVVVALTERQVRASLRSLDLVFAVLAPILTFVGFNIALRSVIDTGGISYAQYVLPAVVVQAMLFGALNTTDLAASEGSSEFGVRLRTFPISVYAPMMARMSYCLIRGLLALIAAFAVAYPFGFRMDGGPIFAAAFVVLALVLTLALSFGAEATGTRAKRSDTSSQLLLVPQLLLVLLSTGMAPVESFPGWVQPFVEYQPISQITETLRGFASGKVAGANLAITLVWCVGLLVGFGYLALQGQRRTR
ncbi:transport permease protein [Mycobacterium antarcticum]|uniref:ABC transporter permease n=1 Tax=Mycolicibacterium sp. TUM20983 TaxID=3023369 RepID=UPI00239B4E67|nr:ABC transporter permease [Mycolicibacterium sp. TUM20983]GLP75772.1 transport permease protein [Mycolicibacterium sp. TUM20983]